MDLALKRAIAAERAELIVRLLESQTKGIDHRDFDIAISLLVELLACVRLTEERW